MKVEKWSIFLGNHEKKTFFEQTKLKISRPDIRVKKFKIHVT
jgi:hypothetical protein